MSGQLSIGASILLSANPLDYSRIRFDAVDILYVSPFCVQKDKTFNFEGDTSALLPIFQSVVKMARGLNPNIQIVAMQGWSDGTTIDQLGNDDDIQTYASSVTQFIVDQKIDGYCNGYQSNNVCPQAGKVFSAVRQKFDKARAAPPYHVSIAPTDPKYLDDESVKSSLNYVSMQNYWAKGDKGGQIINQYKQIFDSTNVNIIFGVNTETAGINWNLVFHSYNAIDTLYDIVNEYGLNGVYNWRLDSGDWIFQNAFQVYLYNRFHSKNLQCPFTLEQVVKTWPNIDNKPVSPFH